MLHFEIHQMDVKTAFLDGFLDEEIYMEQPEGFAAQGTDHLACKLEKSLYGPKQAPRVWYQTLAAFLECIKFRRLIKDRCVFVGILRDQTCYIAVYVDDLLIIAPTPTLVNEIKSAMKQRFNMTDLGEVRYLLGWSIERDRKSRTIFIHQKKYATKTLDRFSHLVTYPVTTPADRSVKLSSAMNPQTDTEKDMMKGIPYREAVESVMYLMIGTRPHLAYYMREVNQYLSDPGEEHWKAVVRGIKYLHGTKGHGLVLGGALQQPAAELTDSLTAYSDSDYASCHTAIYRWFCYHARQ
jgi:hypothetical protein